MEVTPLMQRHEIKGNVSMCFAPQLKKPKKKNIEILQQRNFFLFLYKVMHIFQIWCKFLMQLFSSMCSEMHFVSMFDKAL